MADDEAQDQQGGEGLPEWLEGVQDATIKAHPALKSIPSIEELAKQHIGAQELIGRKGVVLPKEGDDADRDRFYTELGRPATPAEYGIDKMDKAGLDWDPEVESAMAEAFHKHGLTPAQAQGVVQGYVEIAQKIIGDSATELKQEVEAAQKELQKEWGEAYDERASAAQQAFQVAFGDQAQEVAALQIQGGPILGNHPAILKAFSVLGAKLAEAGLAEGGKASATLSPSQAREELEKLQLDPQAMKALKDPSDPAHQAVSARRRRLYEALYPEKTT